VTGWRLDRTWLSRRIKHRETPENFRQALGRKPGDIRVIDQFSEILYHRAVPRPTGRAFG
jgi:hypothetical protein